MSEESERLERRLARATAELESLQSAAADAERQLGAFTSSAFSADGSVEVSVGGQGEVTEIKFLDGKYRSMTASQLSDAVLGTIQDARSHHSRRVRDLFEPLTRPSAVMPELPGLELDWDRILGPAADALPEESYPRGANDRLRDEIDGDEA
ncbi:YbaB/EbfC family nucleoid-associated protein [Streptomyces sp. MH60]|uniref:YbaB/EbfC family nucleoid-associated protein n=1 Tax=Streptomyces sp. MH60 TaxID=1940758 RepID=UPI000CEECBA4|nr:YbaB/EbfC family nucleoid-associated protein [Streptomyces sp. MH60]PPS90950.1 Nucleoid-associated protein YbaB [Streptomyces sp. MH60]